MNMYQKIAFGAPVALAVAFMIALIYGIDGLGLMIVVTLGIALLTLPITWKIILTVVQAVGATIALIGHGVGKLGDMVADFAFTRREMLSSQTNRVPKWDDPNLVRVGSNEPGTFLDEELQPHPAS